MCNWLKSKLQAEFALSSFILCGLVLPSDVPVLQNVGRNLATHSEHKHKLFYFFS